MDEEWRDFEKRHRKAIAMRTKRRTGHLETHREYSTAQTGKSVITSKLTHPIYERFIDMKKNYMGDVKTKWGTKQDVMVRRKGRAIHNRIIFGKLNPLSFRLMHELTDEVRRFTRQWSAQHR